MAVRPDSEGTTEMSTRPNIVLVHGAWADGYHVTAPQFPLTALADDVARLRQVLDLQDGPVIVAGHPCRAGPARDLGAPVVRHRGRYPRGEAADLVRHMAGQHRLPDAVRRADELARTGLPTARLTPRQD